MIIPDEKLIYINSFETRYLKETPFELIIYGDENPITYTLYM